jgi:hypothetical protein
MNCTRREPTELMYVKTDGGADSRIEELEAGAGAGGLRVASRIARRKKIAR